MLNPRKFVRKSFDVTAARVTLDNIEDVAHWCNGEIMEDDNDNALARKYIKVNVNHPRNEEQTKARLGDHVVKSKREFKVYKDHSFRKTFQNPDGTPFTDEEAPLPSNKPSNGPVPGPHLEKSRKPKLASNTQTEVNTSIGVLAEQELAPGVTGTHVEKVNLTPAVENELANQTSEVNSGIHPRLSDDQLRALGKPTSVEEGYQEVYADGPVGMRLVAQANQILERERLENQIIANVKNQS